MNRKKLYQKNWFLITTIFFVSLLFRIAIIFIIAWDRGLHYETVEIARYIVAGHGYWWNWYNSIPAQPTAILPPIYTYFVALFMAFFKNPARWIYVFQAIFNSFGVIPSFYLGKYLNGKKTGVTAAGLFAIFPEIAYSPTKIVAEPIVIAFTVLIILLFLRSKSKMITTGFYRHFIWLGLLIGFVALIKANTAFVFLACFFSLIITRYNRKILFKAAFLLGLGFTFAISPWVVRNTIVFNKPVYRTMYGFNLWRGNHPGASGTGRLDPNTISEDKLDPEYKEYIRLNHPDKEIDLDKFYTNEAIKFIKQDPQRYAWLTLKRIIYFITFDPTHPLTRNVVYIGGYIFVLIFGIWGAILLKKLKRFDNIFILIPIVFLIFYSPVIILPRYRFVVVWMLLALSSVPVAKILSKISLFNKLMSGER